MKSFKQGSGISAWLVREAGSKKTSKIKGVRNKNNGYIRASNLVKV